MHVVVVFSSLNGNPAVLLLVNLTGNWQLKVMIGSHHLIMKNLAVNVHQEIHLLGKYRLVYMLCF